MRPSNDRIAAAISHVRVARRRLTEYQTENALLEPDKLRRTARLLTLALVALGAETDELSRKDYGSGQKSL